MTKHWRDRRTIVALAGLLLASACGGGGGGGGGAAKDDGDGARPSATEADINPVPRDQLADGGTLQWPISGIFPTFNPHHVDGTLADVSAVISGMSFSCYDFDAAAQPILRKEWCEQAKLTATEPKQVVTYRINKKAVWLDGSPITAADFKALWSVRNGTDKAYQVASTQGYDKIESVKAGSDEREVVVTFKEPYANWQGLFGAIQPAKTITDPKVFNEGWGDKPLTSAGPFKFGSLDKTAKTITIVRNEKWWGRPAKLEKIIFRSMDPDQEAAALANGEIDFTDIGPDVSKLRQAEKTAGVDIRKAGGPNFRHITLNSRSENLTDVRVRRAVGLAIDRAAIARLLLGPLGVPAEPLQNHIFMTNQKGYENNAGVLAKADPEAAAKLLDEAGWTGKVGEVRTKGGKKLVLRFVIPSGVASSEQEAKLAQGMLKAVGVEMKIETVPVADFFDQYVRPGNFDLTVFSWLGTVFPISSSKSIYAEPQPGPDGGLDIQQNYARVGSEELDALFDKATAIFDEADANKLGNQIDGMIWEEVHSLTLYQRPDIVATRNDLANFGAFGFATVVFEDIGFEKGGAGAKP